MQALPRNQSFWAKWPIFLFCRKKYFVQSKIDDDRGLNRSENGPHNFSLSSIKIGRNFSFVLFARRRREKERKMRLKKHRSQCDQMIRLFFNIWLFATTKICPIMSQVCQSSLSILPNKKQTLKNMPKTSKLFQSGEISPNLVTLIGAELLSRKSEWWMWDCQIVKQNWNVCYIFHCVNTR